MPRIEIRVPDSISHGSHAQFADGACVMEMVAFIAGEPHSDHPRCACPVITEAAMTLNDRMPDDQTRTRILGQLAFRIAGTRATKSVEEERGYIAADWAVRVFAPIALESVGRKGDAQTLRCLPRIVDRETARAAAAAAYAAASAANAAWELGGRMLEAMIDCDHGGADRAIQGEEQHSE